MQESRLTLGGDGGGVFSLDSHGAVTLAVTRVTSAGRPAAEVADALAGRAPVAAALRDLPDELACHFVAHGGLFQHTCPAAPGLRTQRKR
jgi:hypothetical protein